MTGGHHGGGATQWRMSHWWQGPNVCTETKEVHEDTGHGATHSDNPFYSFHATTCAETDTSRTCTTRLQTHGLKKSYHQTYRCCHGFQRSQNSVCEKVELRPMLDTLRVVGGSAFADLVSLANLEDELQLHNVTVLCPNDEALKVYREDFQDNAIVVDHSRHRPHHSIRGDRSISSLVLSHTLSGFYDTGDFSDAQVLASNGMSSMNVHVYYIPERVVTVNCGRIMSANNMATNGVIHVIDRVLQPGTKTATQTIADDPRFTIFHRLLSQTRLLDQLNEEGRQWTLMAPTDNAFHQMDRARLHKMLQGGGCVDKFVQYHILPRTVCSTALPPLAHSRTLLGSDVRFRRDDDDKVFINDVPVADEDVLATNGIVKVLDEVLMPSDAGSVHGVLDEFQLTDLLSLFDQAGMRDVLEKDNITFFAPTNRALQDAAPYFRDVQRTPEKLRDILRYHISSPATRICTMDNNEQMSSHLTSKSLRFNQYHSPFFGMAPHVTVQCARILEMDRPACNALVQVVEKVLYPPEGNLVDVLSSNNSFSIMKRILLRAEMESELIAHGPYTVLAPTDQAFYRLPEQQLNELLHNPASAEQLVLRHIVPEVICCAGIHHMTWAFQQTVRTLSGDVLHLIRHNGIIRAGDAQIVNCDIMADNGVVHAINRVIERGSRPQPHYYG